MISALLYFLSPPSVSAQVITPIEFFSQGGIPWIFVCPLGLGPVGQVCDLSPAQLISLLLPNILILAGIIFFGLILMGGFGIIVGAGKQASPQEASKAKAAVTYGVIGFLLVISAFFILQIVGVITGINFLTPPI